MCDIHHARMRLGCSMLKYHLHFNLHVEDSPMCSCGSVNEDPPHFIFDCPRYVEQRRILLTELSELEPLNAELLLYGNSDLSIGQNIRIALAMQTFIKTTHRFTTIR